MTAPVIQLPTQDELPCDDGVPMETQRHKMQMDLLIEALHPWLEERDNGYLGGNMFIYYSAAQLKTQDFKGPDFFAVLDVSKGERKSWVVWEEGKTPDVVIELLSDSTANGDKTIKKEIYQSRMRVPEYFWYDPFNSKDFAGFRLSGTVYQPLTLDEQGRYLCQSLQLYLLTWKGSYRGVMTTWLRWADLAGNLLPTGEELVQQAQAQLRQTQTELEEAQAEVQQAQAEKNKLAAKLREMGMDPNQL